MARHPSSTDLGVKAWLTWLGVQTSRPMAFALLLCFAIAWFLFDQESFGWQAVASLATWVMTLFIQRASHRDMQAVHAKLDELLRNDPASRSEFEHIDEEEPEQIERKRRAEQS